MDYRNPGKVDTSESSVPDTEQSQQRTSQEEAADALVAAAQQHVQRDVDAQLAKQADAVKLSEEHGAMHRPLVSRPTTTAEEEMSSQPGQADAAKPEPSQTVEMFSRDFGDLPKSTPLVVSPDQEQEKIIRDLVQQPQLPPTVERVIEEDVEPFSPQDDHNTDSFSLPDIPNPRPTRTLADSFREADTLFVSLAQSIAARSPQPVRSLARLADSPTTVVSGDQTVRYFGARRETLLEQPSHSGAETGARRRLFGTATTSNAPVGPVTSKVHTRTSHMAATNDGDAAAAVQAADVSVDGAIGGAGYPGIPRAMANASPTAVTTTATVGLPPTVYADASRWCSALHTRSAGPATRLLSAGSGLAYEYGSNPRPGTLARPMAGSELGTGKFGVPPYPAFPRPRVSAAAASVPKSDMAAFPRIAAKFDRAAAAAEPEPAHEHRREPSPRLFQRASQVEQSQADILGPGAFGRAGITAQPSRGREFSVHFATEADISSGTGGQGPRSRVLGGVGGPDLHQHETTKDPSGSLQGGIGRSGGAQAGRVLSQMDQHSAIEGGLYRHTQRSATPDQVGVQHRSHSKPVYATSLGDEVPRASRREQVGVQEHASGEAAATSAIDPSAAFWRRGGTADSGVQPKAATGSLGQFPDLTSIPHRNAQTYQSMTQALGPQLPTQPHTHTQPIHSTRALDPTLDISQSMAGLTTNPPMWNFQIPQVSSGFAARLAPARNVQEQLLEMTLRDGSVPLAERKAALATLQNIEDLKKADNRLYEVPSRPQQVRSFSMKDLKIMIGETDDSRQALEKILSLSKINAFDDASLQSALSMSLRGDAHRSFVKLVEHHPVREVFKRLLERYAQKPTLSSAIAKNSDITWDRQTETIWQALARFDETMDDLCIMLPAESRDAMVEQMRRSFVEKAAGAHARDLQLEHIKKLKEGVFWTSSDLARYLEDLTVKGGDGPVLASSVPRSRFDRRHSPYRDTHRTRSVSPKPAPSQEYYPTPAQRQDTPERSRFVDKIEPMEEVTETVQQPSSNLQSSRASPFGESKRLSPRSLSETKDGDIHNHIHCDNSTLHISGVTDRQFRGNSRGFYGNYQPRDRNGYSHNRSFAAGGGNRGQQSHWNGNTGFGRRFGQFDRYQNQSRGWHGNNGYNDRYPGRFDRFDSRPRRNISWDPNRQVRSFGNFDRGFKRRRPSFEADPRKAAEAQSNWKPESKTSLEGE